MITYMIIVVVLVIVYVAIFLFYLAGWLLLPEFKSECTQHSTRVSIIVPARDEEKYISNLLNDLVAQTYPDHLYEIIVVDDFSSDNTASIVQSYTDSRIKLKMMDSTSSEDLNLRSPKKQALRAGIESASGELIITTDADCRIGKNWLKTMVCFYESNRCELIVAPVQFIDNNTFFGRFQILDFAGLAGITGATIFFNFPTMCNGANLAFTKKAFVEVNGYQGVDHLSSGDDMLLMHKIAHRWNNGVKFLKSKEAIVSTFPEPTLKSFMDQRMRWTSKSRSYSDKKIILNLSIVYLFNLSILITLVLTIIDNRYFLILILQIALKLIAEFSFLVQVTKFFRCQKLLSLFLPAQLIHVLYVVIVGAAGNFYKPVWKGRRIV